MDAMEESPKLRKLRVHFLGRLFLLGFIKSEQFDLFCEEFGLENMRDAIFVSLLKTNQKIIRIKGYKAPGEIILDFSDFPEEYIKPFFKSFILNIYSQKEAQFVEIIVSLLTYYSRYNCNFQTDMSTQIDNDTLRIIGIDLLDLGFAETDIRMYFSFAGYDLDSLLTIETPNPVEKNININDKSPKNHMEKSNKIFIVHGHDSGMKTEVELLLKAISLEPVILHQQASRNKTIIEKVEFYSDVSFAVILLTADDIGTEASFLENEGEDTYGKYIDLKYLENLNILFSEFLTKKTINVNENRQILTEVRDLYKSLMMRSRQNVLFECGYFIGKLGRENVAILCDPIIEIPSDLNGLCYLKIDDEGSWRHDLAKEIDAAGIKIDEKSVSIYERMLSYLINTGYELLNINVDLGTDQINEILNTDYKKLSPDFLQDMEYVGFIDQTGELSNTGALFMKSGIFEYFLKYG